MNVRGFVGIFAGEGDEAVGNCDDSRASGGDSTCCVVLLKNLARIGSRNVGGSADGDTGASAIDLLRARENILTVVSQEPLRF